MRIKIQIFKLDRVKSFYRTETVTKMTKMCNDFNDFFIHLSSFTYRFTQIFSGIPRPFHIQFYNTVKSQNLSFLAIVHLCQLLPLPRSKFPVVLNRWRASWMVDDGHATTHGYLGSFHHSLKHKPTLLKIIFFFLQRCTTVI